MAPKVLCVVLFLAEYFCHSNKVEDAPFRPLSRVSSDIRERRKEIAVQASLRKSVKRENGDVPINDETNVTKPVTDHVADPKDEFISVMSTDQKDESLSVPSTAQLLIPTTVIINSTKEERSPWDNVLIAYAGGAIASMTIIALGLFVSRGMSPRTRQHSQADR